MKALISIMALVMTMAAYSNDAQARSCTVLMKNQRGLTVNSFNGWGYDRREACRQATRQCERAVWNGNRPGQLYCEIALNGGGYGHQVTRNCSTQLIGPRGRTIEYFQARATGQVRTGVKQQACRKALRKCNRFKNDYGYYRARCISTEINPPVNPPRRTGPRRPRGPRRGLI